MLWRAVQADRQTDRGLTLTYRQADRHAHIQAPTNEQKNRQTGRQADRQRNNGTLNEINALPVPYSDRFMLGGKIH